ncbi:MAG TPA: hypothetical protein DCS52_30640 [Bradyrhizobium sp.]|nr:hypothetical protein [Bradyrhizobium sp.]
MQEGNRIVPKWDQKSGLLVRQQGVTELKRLIKWPKPPRNLGRAGASVARQARSRALEVAARL